MEKKYESDLTRREKWQKQMETIRKLKGKERLEYLWQYYKMVPVFCIAIVLAVYIVAVMINNSLNDPLLSVVVVDSAKTGDEAAEELQNEILQIVGTGEKHDFVETNLSAVSLDTGVDVTKLRVLLSAAGEADAVICGEEVYEEYSAQGAFVDMKELLGDSYGDYEAYMTDGQIDLSKCPDSFLSSYADYSPAYLCVLVHSERTENAVELIKEVVNE